MGSAPGMVRESFKKRREQGTGIIHGPDTPSVQGLKPDPKAGIASWQIIPFIKPNILVIKYVTVKLGSAQMEFSGIPNQ